MEEGYEARRARRLARLEELQRLAGPQDKQANAPSRPQVSKAPPPLEPIRASAPLRPVPRAKDSTWPTALELQAEVIRLTFANSPLLAPETDSRTQALHSLLARQLGGTAAADAYLAERARLLASEPRTREAPPPLPTGVVRHSTKSKRRDVLDPAIELAQSRCKNAKDTAEVWGQLQALALVEHPPFLGVMPDGLKYTKHGDEAAFFTRDALDKRLHPEKRSKRRKPPQAAA